MSAYVYYSYEEWGRGYIGARSRAAEGDVYFGSFRDSTFNPTHKIVLAEFETMEEALEAEVALHRFFDVARNPHFANLSRQTSTGFTTTGREQNEEWKQKATRAFHTLAAKKKAAEERTKTNREIKTNSFFNPELRKAALDAANKRRVEMKENKETLKWQYLKERRKGWSKELWNDVEEGLALGKRYWGLKDVAKKHGVSTSTVSRIVAHIKNGVCWEDLGG